MECFRTSSSFFNRRISPLTKKYEPPRSVPILFTFGSDKGCYAFILLTGFFYCTIPSVTCGYIPKRESLSTRLAHFVPSKSCLSLRLPPLRFHRGSFRAPLFTGSEAETVRSIPEPGRILWENVSTLLTRNHRCALFSPFPIGTPAISASPSSQSSSAVPLLVGAGPAIGVIHYPML